MTVLDYTDLLVIRRALQEREARLSRELRDDGLETSDELQDIGLVIDRVNLAITVDLNRTI